MPMSEPAKVSISPKAVSTVGSMTPGGGTKNAVVMRPTPKATSTMASRICAFIKPHPRLPQRGGAPLLKGVSRMVSTMFLGKTPMETTKETISFLYLVLLGWFLESYIVSLVVSLVGVLFLNQLSCFSHWLANLQPSATSSGLAGRPFSMRDMAATMAM